MNWSRIKGWASTLLTGGLLTFMLVVVMACADRRAEHYNAAKAHFAANWPDCLPAFQVDRREGYACAQAYELRLRELRQRVNDEVAE